MPRVDPQRALDLAQQDPEAFAALSPAEQVAAARQQSRNVSRAPQVAYKKVTAPPPVKKDPTSFETFFAKKVRQAAASRELRNNILYGTPEMYSGRILEPDRFPPSIDVPMTDENGMAVVGIDLGPLSDNAKEYLENQLEMAQANGTLGMPGYVSRKDREFVQQEESRSLAEEEIKTFGTAKAELIAQARRRAAQQADPSGLDMQDAIRNPERDPAIMGVDEEGRPTLTGHGKSLEKQWETWFHAEHGTEGMPDAKIEFQVRQAK